MQDPNFPGSNPALAILSSQVSMYSGESKLLFYFLIVFLHLVCHAHYVEAVTQNYSFNMASVAVTAALENALLTSFFSLRLYLNVT